MLIREALPTDAAAIASVHVDSWRTTYAGIVPGEYLTGLSYEGREHFWRDILTNQTETNFVYVAEADDGGIIGFASGGPEREGDPVYRAELYAIYLLEHQQRRGNGRQLTAAVATRLLREGYQAMLLWVLKDNPACRFYEAIGGEPLREKPIEIGDTELVEIAYGWKDITRLAEMHR